MNQVADENVGQKPGYIFELGANLGSERTFSIRGNFAVGTTLAQINDELDKLVKATDRQLSRACIPGLEDALAKDEQQLDQFKRNLVLIEKKQAGHKSLPAQAESERDNANANILQMQAMIERKKKFLEKTREDAK